MKTRRGFSLIELLVVIGIVGVLVAIAYPIIGSVRKSAQAANSQQQLSSIAGAIQRYYTDFNSYPGIFSQADITAGVNSTNAAGTGRRINGLPLANNLTESENLTLALLGGITTPTTATTAGTYTSASFGMGPMTFTMTGAVQRRKDAYISASPSWMSKEGKTITPVIATNTITNAGVPIFMDQFSDPMPVIYLRARVGAQGVSAATDTAQYNTAHLIPYVGALNFPYSSEDLNSNGTIDLINGGPQTEDTNGDGVLTRDFLTADAFLTNPSMAGQPRGKDSFILISPGKDRAYGTKDDLIN